MKEVKVINIGAWSCVSCSPYETPITMRTARKNHASLYMYKTIKKKWCSYCKEEDKYKDGADIREFKLERIQRDSMINISINKKVVLSENFFGFLIMQKVVLFLVT